MAFTKTGLKGRTNGVHRKDIEKRVKKISMEKEFQKKYPKHWIKGGTQEGY